MLRTFRKLPKKKQGAVLNAAARAFAQKGYYRANVAEICKRARISNGALYKYFKNKEDVFKSVFDRTAHLFSIAPERLSSSDKSVYQKLQDILCDIVKLSDRHADYIAVYFDLGSPSMSEMAPLLSERIEEPSKQFWLRLVEEGKKRGEIHERIDDNVASYAIDNYVMLFMFSCVSEHYDRRFSSYFGKRRRRLTKEEKISIILDSLRSLFSDKG